MLAVRETAKSRWYLSAACRDNQITCDSHLNRKTPESSCRQCETELRCICGMQGGGGWVPPEAAAAAVDHATLFSSWTCPACTLINAPQVAFLLFPVLACCDEPCTQSRSVGIKGNQVLLCCAFALLYLYCRLDNLECHS